jgi:sugar phosphate isomerase/epimerase
MKLSQIIPLLAGSFPFFILIQGQVRLVAEQPVVSQVPLTENPTPDVGRGRAGKGPEAPVVPVPPARGSASVRETDTFQLRTGVSGVLGWKVGVPAGAFSGVFFADGAAAVDAAGRADALSVSAIEASGAQKVSGAIPRNLDFGLFPNELRAVRNRLIALNLSLSAYSVPVVAGDERTLRNLFQFAKELGVETIVSEQIPDNPELAGRLADEYGVPVAICGSPKIVLAAIEKSRSKNTGACGDTSAWMKEGVKPADALTQLGNRLYVVRLRDRTSLGAGGRDIALGTGAAGVGEFLRQMYDSGIKPKLITIEPTGAGDTFAGLSQSLVGFEKLVRPVFAAQVAQLGRATPIKGPDKLPPGMKEKIEAALPAKLAAAPRKPRRILVFDLNVGYGGASGGHQSISAVNLLIDAISKKTGAFQTVFSNDLDNFKYDKLQQFDAVLLNNTVGMVFPDQEVRDGLLRFVREGGGLAAYHGASYASMDWPEFGEMLGTRQGHARDNYETDVIKIDDPSSPLVKPLGDKPFRMRTSIIGSTVRHIHAEVFTCY